MPKDSITGTLTQSNNAMKPIQATLNSVAAVAFIALALGCAADLKNKENLAAAAGFKVITPVKPDQVALLPTLPKDKVTPITYEGKLYYVLPDAKNNQAWVGGPAEFETYKRLRQAQQISNENLAAAQMNQMNTMNWGAWGGWGGMGVYRGGYRR